MTRYFKMVYQIVCYLFFFLGLFFMLFIIYSNLKFGFVLNFLNRTAADEVDYTWYYSFLVGYEELLAISFLAWVFLSLTAVFIKQFQVKRMHVIAGIIAVILFVAYIIIDPFRLVAYLID